MNSYLASSSLISCSAFLIPSTCCVTRAPDSSIERISTTLFNFLRRAFFYPIFIPFFLTWLSFDCSLFIEVFRECLLIVLNKVTFSLGFISNIALCNESIIYRSITAGFYFTDFSLGWILELFLDVLTLWHPITEKMKLII